MKFRLTYEGRLEADGSPQHKQEIRKAFHPQLRRLWDVEPNLQSWGLSVPVEAEGRFPDTERFPLGEKWARDVLAFQYDRLGYHFVPLATASHSLIAGLELLFLRPDVPGSIIRSGDIDNRLKTLFDALQMPRSKAELGAPYQTPGPDEDPFYVLMEDDRLLSHVSVETDVLLQPTPTAKGEFLTNDARLVLTISLRPYHVTMENLHFA